MLIQWLKCHFREDSQKSQAHQGSHLTIRKNTFSHTLCFLHFLRLKVLIIFQVGENDGLPDGMPPGMRKKSQVKMKKKSYLIKVKATFFCRVCVSVQTAKIDDLDGENVA